MTNCLKRSSRGYSIIIFLPFEIVIANYPDKIGNPIYARTLESSRGASSVNENPTSCHSAFNPSDPLGSRLFEEESNALWMRLAEPFVDDSGNVDILSFRNHWHSYSDEVRAERRKLHKKKGLAQMTSALDSAKTRYNEYLQESKFLNNELNQTMSYVPKALQILQSVEDTGDPQILSMLADVYHREGNKYKHLMYLKSAADVGHAASAGKIGIMYVPQR